MWLDKEYPNTILFPQLSEQGICQKSKRFQFYVHEKSKAMIEKIYKPTIKNNNYKQFHFIYKWKYGKNKTITEHSHIPLFYKNLITRIL